MAWLEKPRKHYVLRDYIGGKQMTIIRNLGVWKGYADTWLVEYRKAVANGFTFQPPITPSQIKAFLEGKTDDTSGSRAIPVREMVDLVIKHCGPSISGAKERTVTYRNFISRMNIIKDRLGSKMSDSVTKYDVRDFISEFKTIGTQKRYIGALGRVYNVFYDWNEDEKTIVGFTVKLPTISPVKRWLKEMKPAQKRELPDTRVLSLEEWGHFKKFLKARTLAICELALKRFLRLANIKKIDHLQMREGYIKGLQAKTGEPFSVPVLSKQPTRYDFTNFKRDFINAQKKAGMYYPPNHPLHFSIKDLRRTGATWAYRATKDLVGVSEMLGHTNTRSTRRYLNISETDKLRIASAVDRMADKPVKTHL